MIPALPNPSELRSLLDFAIESAWLAGRVTLRHFQAGTGVERKPNGTHVTIADREAEMLMRDRIERYFPDDGILGEEFGLIRGNSPRHWIIDPIDGTASFIHGVPLYGVLIGLAIGEEAWAGAAHFPALDDMVEAARGLGCRWNGRPARVSQVDRLEEAAILLTDSARDPGEISGRRELLPGWSALARRADVVRTWGDCYGHVLVATGRAEAMIDPRVSPWDVAALAPIVTEAGGVFTDLAGQGSVFGGSGLSTNAALAAEVRDMLGRAAT